jgi:flagellar biosynthesis chaperone FliJ
MSNEITKRDLEDHYLRTREANKEVVSVLRDVAVQFNTIATQLQQLARTQEDTLAALVDRVQGPIDTSIQYHHERVESSLDHGIEKVTDEISSNCQNCFQRLETITGKVEDLKTLTEQIQGSIGEQDKERIKNRTNYLLIIGAITALATLLGTLYTQCDSLKSTVIDAGQKTKVTKPLKQ